MKLLLKSQRAKMVANFHKGNETGESSPPVVKLFNPWGPATWLFSEYDDENKILTGLCDLGMGSPEFGSVSLQEITSFGRTMAQPLPIERDRHWKPEPGATMSDYMEQARDKGRIVDYPLRQRELDSSFTRIDVATPDQIVITEVI